MNKLFNKPEYFYQAILLTLTILVSTFVLTSIDVLKTQENVKKKNSSNLNSANEDINASGIFGGEIYYNYIEDNSYDLHVDIFVECQSISMLKKYAEFKVYDADNMTFNSVRAKLDKKEKLIQKAESNCIENQSNDCFFKVTYKSNVRLSPSNNGYKVTFQNYFRSQGIQNIQNSEKTLFTLMAEIPGKINKNFKNNSPRLLDNPQHSFCAFKTHNFSMTVEDLDGDSTVYEFNVPFASVLESKKGTPNNSMKKIKWKIPFGLRHPFGKNSISSINNQSGELIINSNNGGLFLIGIAVKEYRKGVFIGKSEREILYKVNVPLLNFEKVELLQSQNTETPKNIVSDQNDQRDKSRENYSQDVRVEKIDVESAEDYEKKLWDETQGDDIRKKMREDHKKNKTTLSKKEKNPTASDGSENQYAGKVMVNFKLGTNRKAFKNNNWYVRNPGYTCGRGSGRVFVNIRVGQDGKVRKAVIDDSQSYSSNSCMRSKALEYAYKSRFEITSDSNKNDDGYIIYEFVSQ